MKAKRLLTALLIALLVSGLFTFWLSRRVAKGGSCDCATEATLCRGERAARSG